MESPLEALSLEVASFGVLAVVNNVWTWIAVVTAAVSFWRIKVTSNLGDGNGHACVLLEELTGSKSDHEESNRLESKSRTGPVKETMARVKETVTKTETLMCDDGGVTKGKLTMYYDVDVDGGMCIDGDLTAVSYGGDFGNCGGEEWFEKWERVVKMRNGDDTWYRYVDLTVINGNVVRLWDDNNRASNCERCLN